MSVTSSPSLDGSFKQHFTRFLALTMVFGVTLFGTAACESANDEEVEAAAEGADAGAEGQTANAANNIVAEGAEIRGDEADGTATSEGAQLGTPMAQRVATIGFLNKRNNEMRDLQMKPGEARRIGNVVVRLEACERTAPWESPAESGAFVKVLVQDKPRRGSDEEPKWKRIFSGWLFKESPSVNVVEHPIYDVWLKNCAMRFPGEEDAEIAASADSEAAPDARSANAAAPSSPSASSSANASGSEGSPGSASPPPARPAPSRPAPARPEPTIEDLLDDIGE